MNTNPSSIGLKFLGKPLRIYSAQSDDKNFNLKIVKIAIKWKPLYFLFVVKLIYTFIGVPQYLQYFASGSCPSLKHPGQTWVDDFFVTSAISTDTIPVGTAIIA